MKSHALIQNVQVLEYWSTNTEINIEWNAYSDMGNINIHEVMILDNKYDLASLSPNSRDHVTSILKSAFGIIPYFGATAQELIGIVIPQQRMERVVSFVKKLAFDLEKMQISLEEIKEKLFEPQYSSLFYKASLASADSTSDDRIEYVKNVFICGITAESSDIVLNESILSIVGKMNDIELKYLRAYYLIKWDIAQAREYMTLAGVEILTPNKHGGMSQVELDRETAKAIYLTSLHNLGVLDIEYDNRGKAKYKCSAVGDLVIRKILKL